MAAADQYGILFESVHLKKDGSPLPVEVSSTGAAITVVIPLVSA
jgi:hypothetical protein